MYKCQLAEDAKRGSRYALARLLQDNYEIVYRYLIKFTLNSALAEDLAQETMLRAIEKFNLYDPEKAAFSTWLITVAQNIYMDQLRKHKKEQITIEDGNDMLWGSTECVYDDSWGRVLDALQKLDAQYRFPLIMKHYYGYSYEEIARKMSIPEGTVKSRVHTALNLLRKELD